MGCAVCGQKRSGSPRTSQLAATRLSPPFRPASRCRLPLRLSIDATWATTPTSFPSSGLAHINALVTTLLLLHGGPGRRRGVVRLLDAFLVLVDVQ